MNYEEVSFGSTHSETDKILIRSGYGLQPLKLNKNVVVVVVEGGGGLDRVIP
jgi:hypothetical protein